MSDPDSTDPSQPAGPQADDTQRLPAGEPPSPYATQRLNLAEHLDPTRTVKLALPVEPGDPTKTQKLSLPREAAPPIRVQRVDTPVEAAGSTHEEVEPKASVPMATTRAPRWRTPVLVAGLVGVSLVVFLLVLRGLSPTPQASQPSPSEGDGPKTPEASPDVRPYLERAQAGDTTAMQMLGLMYTNGLGVPRDREKGLSWYRKAAQGGSRGAQAELKRLEAPAADPTR